MPKVERNFAAEKEKVYVTGLQLIKARRGKAKKDPLSLVEITEASGLPKTAVANALKWLKRKELADTAEVSGWFMLSMHPKRVENFCWKHGVFKEVSGRGKKRRVFCPICDRAAIRAGGVK